VLIARQLRKRQPTLYRMSHPSERPACAILRKSSWLPGLMPPTASPDGGKYSYKVASMACHGLNCSNTRLINAHILPKGFARLMRADPSVELLKLAADGVSRAYPQLGETDPEILCADCDGALGRNDGYAVEVCRKFRADDRAAIFEDKSADAERFSTFILSFLWRASIGKNGRYCSVVTFGPYEPLARKIIFGAQPISDMRAFKLIASRLRSANHDVNRIITDPIRFKLQKLNAYRFLLAGFQLDAILDGQELGPEFDVLIINRTKVFRGTYLEFETLPEFQRLTEIFTLNDKSRRKPTPATK
jgi:hypothetical protein